MQKRKIFPRTLILLSLLQIGCLSGTAYADFFSDSVQAYNQSYRFPDPALATLAGGAKAYVENTVAPDFSIQFLNMPNSNFREGSLPVSIYKYGGYTTRPTQLIVILSGLFNNADDALPLHALRLARALNAHALVIPNSFSTSYMNQGPLFAIADFVQEANIILQVTNSAIQSQFGKNNVTSVKLIGESYGGFMVPVVLTQDTSHIFGDEAVSLSPPVNILTSMKRIDALINSQAGARSGCVDSDVALLEAGEFAAAINQSEITSNVAQCAPAFLAYTVFQQSLVQSAMRMNGAIFGKLSASQKNQLTFNSFFNLFEPGIIQSRAPQAMSLESWLQQAEQTHPGLKMKIITSEDDFLNSGDQWNTSTRGKLFRFDQDIVRVVS